MEFRLLGAFEIWDGATEVRAVRRQERLLLAALLLKANEVVAIGELVDLLWPEEPPGDARGAVQVYVSRLRKAGVRIQGTTAGYAVEVDPDEVDVVRFRRIAGQARRLADPAERADRLRAALELWRGQPLADLGPARERLGAGLEEERRTAEEDRIDADLAAGRHELLATELAELVAAAPLRERLVIAWMTALYRAGRRDEALTAYAGLADRLSDEFGLDPAPAVRRLRLAILRNDPGLLLRASGEVLSEVPRELPVDISLLLGRDELLAEATAELSRGGASVYCLWGGAGVGKSAAGTRIGHLVASAFPDGQLFARLQDVDGVAVPARTLLGRMLRSLGVKPGAVPDSVEERAQLFQEQTAERGVLVVLDDALDVGEVEPLLPSGARCAAIVTSRRPLRELTAATHRQVSPLDEPTSRGLLTQLIGRTLSDQATVDTVAAGCAGLPLALRIVGSRLALSGDDALQSLVGALADDERRLDSLVAGDLAVRASLDRTLALADPDAGRLFDCLSLVGVTEFPSWVAAPLLDCDEPAGVATFTRLVDLGLVEPVGHGQYKMHDLVRSYSTERLADADADAPRKRYLAAVHRLTALADKRLNHGLTLTAHLSAPDQPSLPEAERILTDDPTTWFSRSWQLINAAAFAAVRSGEIELAGLLALHVNNYYLASEQLEPRIAVLEAARDALRVTGPFELAVRTEVAVTHAYHRPPLEMLREGERLLELANRAGSPDLQVRAFLEMNHGARWSGSTEEALGYCAQALAIVDASGELELMRPVVLRHMASGYTDLHDYPRAVATLEKVLEISVPGTMSVGQDLSILAEIKLELGELDESEQLCRQAMTNFRSVSSYYHLAWPTAVLARVMIQRGRPAEAARLIADVESWFEVEPWPVQVQLRPAKASLAFANGDPGAGREIIREVIEKARARGDNQFAAAFQQHLDELEEKHRNGR